ncbi:hypothetical protein GLW08_12710 [Pontibacillus yanchengensis]|uniref:Uncharacterized protein n=2 Tax=Pontibacillus yanchengensis TaxID=462910 RepID=A0ACC7VHD7_9BACI|nr:hypothetical protein [Pontibacillus yanchengensis]
MEELKDDLIEDEHLFNSYTSLKFYYYKNLKTVKPQYEHYRQEKAYIEKAFAFLDEYINTVKV